MFDVIFYLSGFFIGCVSGYGFISLFDDFRCKVNKSKKGHCNSSFCRARNICPYSLDFVNKNIYGKK